MYSDTGTGSEPCEGVLHVERGTQFRRDLPHTPRCHCDLQQTIVSPPAFVLPPSNETQTFFSPTVYTIDAERSSLQ